MQVSGKIHLLIHEKYLDNSDSFVVDRQCGLLMVAESFLCFYSTKWKSSYSALFKGNGLLIDVSINNYQKVYTSKECVELFIKYFENNLSPKLLFN